MTTLQLSQTELFTRGQFLIKSLHDKGRADDAVTGTSLLAALKPARQSKCLTTGEVAKRLGLTLLILARREISKLFEVILLNQKHGM